MNMEERIAQAKNPSGCQGKETLERMNKSHETLTLWALSQLSSLSKEPNQILDVGCGGGATLARLLAKYPKATVHGIDYSPEGVALSRAYNEKELGTRCHVVEGSVLNLPYEREQFSLITAFETIYFWGDYPKALGEIRRVLTADGTFLVCCEMSAPENPRWQEALPFMELRTASQWQALCGEQGFSSTELLLGEGEWFCLLLKK